MVGFGLLLLSVVVSLPSAAVPPQESGLTLESLRDLARRTAPLVVAARTRVEEARGRLTSASYLLPENPLLELEGGPRFDRGDATAEFDASLSVPLSTGGKRSYRIDSARAEVEAEVARASDAVRFALAEVSGAFYGLLFAEERIRLAEERERIDRELLETAERRERAGEAPAFEVQLAGVEAGRSRAELFAARGARTLPLADLKGVLGWPHDRPLSIEGNLRDRRRFELDALIRRASDRPDLLALAAEALRAQADVGLASARRWPDPFIRIGYSRDEGADILRAGVGIPLPLLDRGQGASEEARARASRVANEHAFARIGAESRLRLTWERFERLEEAARALEEEALPHLEEAERFARTGYEAGYVPLSQWLVTRREILETRAGYLQRLLEAALAGVDLELEAGALR